MDTTTNCDLLHWDSSGERNFTNNELQKRKISNNVTNNDKIAANNNKRKEKQIQ